MGCILIINAFCNNSTYTISKTVDFKTQTKVSLIASVSSGVIGVCMAFAGLGVWSLVGQQVSRQLLNACFLWYYAKWLPAVQFSLHSF